MVILNNIDLQGWRIKKDYNSQTELQRIAEVKLLSITDLTRPNNNIISHCMVIDDFAKLYLRSTMSYIYATSTTKIRF